MDPIDQPNLSEAVERLWTRFLPQMLERVAILETAAAACNAGNLSIEQRQTANDAAHKLAGVLGTFDLPRGTILARELEGMYSREEELMIPFVKKFCVEIDVAGKRIVVELRDLVENRK